MAYFAPYIDASGIHMPTYEDRLQDLSVTGPFGSSREKITPAWNQKYWMDSMADLVIEVEQ